ncbi:hypothetical protein CRUP_025270 [Coryphaenoides rupestris]|nr:hypothetical protein CRUP_025270 [Coryphaenoides rupestris]
MCWGSVAAPPWLCRNVPAAWDHRSEEEEEEEEEGEGGGGGGGEEEGRTGERRRRREEEEGGGGRGRGEGRRGGGGRGEGEREEGCEMVERLVATIKDHITKPTAMAQGRVAHLIEWKGWGGRGRGWTGVAEQFALAEAAMNICSLDDRDGPSASWEGTQSLSYYLWDRVGSVGLPQHLYDVHVDRGRVGLLSYAPVSPPLRHPPPPPAPPCYTPATPAATPGAAAATADPRTRGADATGTARLPACK